MTTQNETELPLSSTETTDTTHVHEWVVFSTDLTEGWLILQCPECGLEGTVEDPTAKEWDEAFVAPARPYRWHEPERVCPQMVRPLHVMGATGGRKCECYARRGLLEPGEYERIPAEFIHPRPKLTEAERKEFEEVAERVSQSDLCSRLFPAFIRSFSNDTGHRFGDAMYEVANRIEEIDRAPLHCSPSVVAWLLREWAKQDSHDDKQTWETSTENKPALEASAGDSGEAREKYLLSPSEERAADPEPASKATDVDVPPETIMVAVRRQWNQPCTIDVPLEDLRGFHWRQTSGGVQQRLPRPFLHARMWCTSIPDGSDFPHSCLHGPPPHDIIVCICKKDNPKVFDKLIPVN